MKDQLSNAGLLRLRSWRSKPERDLSIGAIVESLARQAAAQQRRIGGIADIWDELVPAGVKRICEPTGMSGGVLTVKAASAAARFQLDRWLRSGGEASLHKRGGVKRIKIV